MNKDLYKNRVRSCIGIGKKNARSLKEISASAGIPERSVKEMVNILRKEGTPIVSSSYGGYFIPDPDRPEDIMEARRFLLMQQNQAMERFKTCRPIKRWLASLKQMKLEEA